MQDWWVNGAALLGIIVAFRFISILALSRRLKDALVTVGKLADKGVDIRLAVKLVDDDGACVTPADWSSGATTGCPACVSPASTDERPKISLPPVISIPGEAQHCAV